MLRVPEALAFVVLSVASAATVAGCDDSSSGPRADANQQCSLVCIPDQFFDDGGPVGDAGVLCPPCADEVTHECPSGCRPVG